MSISPVPLRVLTRRLAFQGDALAVYTALAADRATSFAFQRCREARLSVVLEPALHITGRGREVRVRASSALGAGLIAPLAAALAGLGTASVDGSQLRFLPRPVDPALDEAARLRAPGPLDLLRVLVLEDAVLASAEPGRRLVAGLFGYDLVDAYERLPAPRLAGRAPPLDLVLAQTSVEFDLESGTAELSTLVRADAGAREEAGAMGQLAALAVALERRPPAVGQAVACTAKPDLDDAQFAALVARLQGEVRAGEVFQIVPSRSFRAPCPDALAALRRLASLDPSAYAFHLRSADRELFGCSPESALRVLGRRIVLNPVAGTRSRRSTAGLVDREHEARAMAELHLDAKETAEHMMLVDLARNDLARVARTGTRELRELLRLSRHSHVMHLASELEAQLATGLDALHALVACLNPGTLTGAPRLRAMELLRAVEPLARGAYGGALGVLRGDGSLDTAIVIRSAEVWRGMATVRAGAGVVLDSEPHAEAGETRRKAAAVLAALGVQDLPA